MYVCVIIAMISSTACTQRTTDSTDTADRWSCASGSSICVVVEVSLSSPPHHFAGISWQECACVRACEWNNGAMFDLHCKSWQFCKMSSYIRNNMFYLLTFDFDFADSYPTVFLLGWQAWATLSSLPLLPVSLSLSLLHPHWLCFIYECAGKWKFKGKITLYTRWGRTIT